MLCQQRVEPRAIIRLDRRKRERERLGHAPFAQSVNVTSERIKALEAMLARKDQFGIGLRELRRANVRLGSIGVIRMKQPHQAQGIAFASAEYTQHTGCTVTIIFQVRLEGMTQFFFARERLEIPAEPRPIAEAILPRHDKTRIRKARALTDFLVRQRHKVRMIVAEARRRTRVSVPHVLQELACTIALARDLRAARKFCRIGIHRARQASFSRLTPCGGGMSSGTKKSICSRCVGSARYWSKSLTPSPARNVSSSRKFPVKLLGLWKIA